MIANLLILAALAASQPQSEENADRRYEAMSLEQLAAELSSLDTSASACTTAVPLLREIAKRRPDTTAVLIRYRLVELSCANDRQEYSRAMDLLEATPELKPFVPAEARLAIALNARNASAVADGLREILLSNDKQRVAALTPEMTGYAFALLREAQMHDEFDRLALVAMEGPARGWLDKEALSLFAARAFHEAVTNDKYVLAKTFLPAIKYPPNLTGLLASKKYLPLWPDIEARAGKHYENITREYRQSQMTSWKADPGNPDKFKLASYALFFDGDFEKAITFVDAATGRKDFHDTIREGEAWALNIKAYSLDALGRTKEADLVFDQLAKLDPIATKPWMINFVINRASRLVGQGRWEEGLRAAALAREMADKRGTSFAKMLVARDHVCALTKLGRNEEVAPHMAYIQSTMKEHPLEATTALQCVGRSDDAAALLAEGLRSSATADRIIYGMQAEAFDMFYTRSLLPRQDELLRSHPALRDALFEQARLIPEEYYPAASLKR